jgi:hypothetical protein
MTSNTPQDKEGQIGFVLGKLEGATTEILSRGVQPEYFISGAVAWLMQIERSGINQLPNCEDE